MQSEHDLFSAARGRDLRDAGIAAVEANSEAWVRAARALAIHLAGKYGNVTSDAIQAILPRPDYVHPNAVGAIFKTRRLRLSTYVVSSRASAHARRIGVYVLTPSTM